MSRENKERSGLILYGTDTPIEELSERWNEIDKCEHTYHKFRMLQRRLNYIRDGVIVSGVTGAVAVTEFADKISSVENNEDLFTPVGVGVIVVAASIGVAGMVCRFTADVNATKVRKLAKEYGQPVPLWAAESARQGELFDSWANANKETNI